MSIVQLSRFLSFFPRDSFDILSNPFRFVKNFFIFLLSPTGQLRYSTIYFYHLSTVFYKFFQFFLPVPIRHYIWYFYMILSTSLPWIYKNYRIIPVVSADNIKRRKRDLNPRAGFPTYTLSRGASSASWVFLPILNSTAALCRNTYSITCRFFTNDADVIILNTFSNVNGFSYFFWTFCKELSY